MCVHACVCVCVVLRLPHRWTETGPGGRKGPHQWCLVVCEVPGSWPLRPPFFWEPGPGLARFSFCLRTSALSRNCEPPLSSRDGLCAQKETRSLAAYKHTPALPFPFPRNPKKRRYPCGVMGEGTMNISRHHLNCQKLPF